MYNALDVARFVIWYSHIRRYGVTNLRLQLMLYFIQLHFLYLKEYPCFTEIMRALDTGPVVPIVYREYKKYGFNEIPCDNSQSFHIDKNGQELLKKIIEDLAKYTTWKLVDLAKQQQPWRRAYIPFAENVIQMNDIKVVQKTSKQPAKG